MAEPPTTSARRRPRKPLRAGVATIGSFDVFRINADVNAPLSPQKNVTARITGSMESSRSFVDFVRARSFDIAPMIAFDADNGDRITLRAEHNARRFVYRDGAPASPIFLHVPRDFYAGAPVNEHESPHYTDLTLTHRHDFGRDWKLATLVDFYLFANRWGWFTGWGYDGAGAVTFGQPARTRTAIRNFDAQVRLEGRFSTANSTTRSSSVSNTGTIFWVMPMSSPAIRWRRSRYFAPPIRGASISPGPAGQWRRPRLRTVRLCAGPRGSFTAMAGADRGRYDLLAQRERVFDRWALSREKRPSRSARGFAAIFHPAPGVLYAPDETTQLFAAFGQSLIPNIGARLQDGAAPAPQQDTQYEIGVRRAFSEPKIHVEIGLFDITRDHVAITNPANPSGFYSLITGRQHSHGSRRVSAANPRPG